jgi:hypothetical protein
LGGGFQPVFELAGALKKIDLCLTELEVGVEDVKEALAFLNAGVLLVLWGHLGVGVVSGAGLELDEEGVKLVLGDGTVDGSELDTGGELFVGVGEL